MANSDDPAKKPSAPLPKLQPLAQPRAPGQQTVFDRILGDHRALGIAGAALLLMLGAASMGVLPGFGPDTNDAPKATGTTLISAVPRAEIDAAIALLAMNEADKTKVRAALASGNVRLGRVVVSDSQDEDGDWVRISAANFRQDIRLFHKPHVVIVPYTPGAPVTVTGLIDGGGGNITVSVHVGTGSVGLKPLKPGDAVQVPTQ